MIGMEGIIGRKIGMTRTFDPEGEVIPATVIEAGPCHLVQVKTEDKDGYEAIQLGFGDKRESLFNKPLSGHFTKAKIEPKRFLKEIKCRNAEKLKLGQKILVNIFSVGEKVDVTGISKGLGFQGGVRRYGFRGGPKSHGQSDRERAPGSIGASSYPSRVWKGQRMAGRMGKEKVTVKNLEIVEVDEKRNLLVVKGAVPGKRNTLLTIRKSKKLSLIL